MARFGPWIVNITVPDLRDTLCRVIIVIILLAGLGLGVTVLAMRIVHPSRDDGSKVSISANLTTVLVSAPPEQTTIYLTTTESGLSTGSRDTLTMPAFTAESAQLITPDAGTSTLYADQPGNYVLPTNTISNNTALTKTSASNKAPPLYAGPLITAAPVNATCFNRTGDLISPNATMWKRASNWRLEAVRVCRGIITASLPRLAALPALPTLQLHRRDAFDSAPTLYATRPTLGMATLTLSSPDDENTTTTGDVIMFSDNGFTYVSVEAATPEPVASLAPSQMVTSAASKLRTKVIVLAILVSVAFFSIGS